MQRFEITGTATDVFPLESVQTALRAVGASRVNARRAFGWSNQPPVATFAATDDASAKRICDAARERLNHPSSLPALIPHSY